MFAYPESNIGYIRNHFNSPKKLHWDRKVGDDITQSLTWKQLVNKCTMLAYAQLFIEYRTSGQQLIRNVEIHTGDRQLVHLYVELTMREECWIKLCV
jgi:hypothetical protein